MAGAGERQGEGGGGAGRQDLDGSMGHGFLLPGRRVGEPWNDKVIPKSARHIRAAAPGDQGGYVNPLQGLTRSPGPLETVEDEPEPVFEFESVIVAGPQHVVGEHLRKMGVHAREERLEHLPGLLPDGLGRERQVEVCRREAVDVPVEQRIRVGHHPDVEPGPAKAADHGVVVPKVGRAGSVPRLHQPDRPAMAGQGFADRGRPPMHGLLPIDVGWRQADLFEYQVDDTVHDVVLVVRVTVESHGPHAQLLAEPAHGEGFDPVLVGQDHGGAQHPVSAQRRSAFGRRPGSLLHRHPHP